jgi:hypothetical protein
MIDWANGDARIIEGEVGGYSLSFEVYNGVAALERVLLLEKSKAATFSGDVTIAKSTPKLIFNNLSGGGLDPSLTASGSNFTISTTSLTALSLALDTGDATFAGDLFPASTGASDLGSDAKRFGSLFTNGAYIGTLTSVNIQLQGALKVLNNAQTAYINFATRNTSGSEAVMDITNAGSATFAGNVSLADNKELIFGAATDFKIYHNSTTNVNHISSQLDRQLALNANTIRFTNQANTTERMRIDSVGDVGIGETAPDARLHITALASSGISNIKVESPGASKWAFGIPAGQTYLAFDETNDSLSTPTMVMTKTTKNVGIGTATPAAKLDVAGGIRMADDTSTATSTNVGTMRYRDDSNTSYVDMCMRTSSGYEWVNIVQNNYGA